MGRSFFGYQISVGAGGMLTPTVLAGRAVGLLRSNTAFVIGAVVAVNMLRIVSSMVLTRLLDASAFGIVGLLTSVTYVLTMLSDVGFLAFIVRHEDADDKRFLNQVWTLRLIRSVLLALLMLSLAWPVAGFVGQPEMGPVLAVWSVTFIIEGFSSLVFATGLRNNELKKLSLLDLLIAVLQLVISAALCAWLRSYWGLVIAGIMTAVIKTILTYGMFPDARRRFTFDRQRASELWRFSRFIAWSSALTVVVTQIDKLIFARLMPIQTFGLFTIAASLAYAPAAINASFAEKLLFPALAREKHDRRGVFYRKRRPIVWPYAFAVGGLIGSAPLVVEILYDPRYRDAAGFIQILAIATLMTMGTAAANQALIASNRTSYMLYANLGRAAWLITGGAITLVLDKPIVLVWTVGLIEIPPTLIFWWALSRFKMLSLIEELATPVLAIAGAAVGAAMSTFILSRFVPGL